MKNATTLSRYALSVWGLTALLLLPLSASAAIYRTVDAAGNITYTDQPPADAAENTEDISGQIDVLPPNTFTDPTPLAPYEAWIPDAQPGEAEDVVGYRSLKITSPTHDESLRDNAGNVVVRSQLAPKLQQGHALHLELDGTLQAEPAEGADVYLTNVPRGTHHIRMVVLNKAGKRVFESDKKVFHLQRISILQNRSAVP